MKTTHNLLFQDARSLDNIPTESVDLVVTSPPYPMIAMWDEAFGALNSDITIALQEQVPQKAYTLMHEVLQEVWREMYRVLKFGGFACINIGDATRKLGHEFGLYPNHAMLINNLSRIGFTILPDILWRKQTNAPNKFMGSGMLPAGAYVTLEHEYILIARKGAKRVFQTNKEKAKRYESAMFWEERNVWYSDIWTDVKGVNQKLHSNSSRARSASFPFELVYRLINMYSVKNDVVLDPFVGTGTTMAAATASSRNSIGVEIIPYFRQTIAEQIRRIEFANKYQANRLKTHQSFVENCKRLNKPLKYMNRVHQLPVKTSQEKDIFIDFIEKVEEVNSEEFEVTYLGELALNSFDSISANESNLFHAYP